MATPSSIGLQAAGLLATLGDPDADPNRSHAVIVTDPVVNPGFLEAYGPYENAAEAAAALEVIRAKILLAVARGDDYRTTARSVARRSSTGRSAAGSAMGVKR